MSRRLVALVRVVVAMTVRAIVRMIVSIIASLIVRLWYKYDFHSCLHNLG